MGRAASWWRGSSEATELAERADLAFDGPRGVVALLGTFADCIGSRR
ncbi:hypothetical protein ACFCY8_11480 [Streptomyces noursei]